MQKIIRDHHVASGCGSAAGICFPNNPHMILNLDWRQEEIPNANPIRLKRVESNLFKVEIPDLVKYEIVRTEMLPTSPSRLDRSRNAIPAHPIECLDCMGRCTDAHESICKSCKGTGRG